MNKAVRRPVKISRAPGTERERAKYLVKLYRTALAAGRTLVMNPDAPFEEQQRFFADEVFLLNALEGFADHGTFDVGVGLFALLQGFEVREALLTCQSPRYADKVQAVMDKLKVSEWTARRLIKNARPKH